LHWLDLKAGEVISFEGKEITVAIDIKSKHKNCPYKNFESGVVFVHVIVFPGGASANAS